MVEEEVGLLTQVLFISLIEWLLILIMSMVMGVLSFIYSSANM